jgi:hypothetical protein
MVKQLCTQSELGYELVKEVYEAQERVGFAEGLLDFRKCHELLFKLLELFSQTIIAIDALDECDPQTRYRILDGLRDLCERCPGRVHIFVSSRNDQDIYLELKGVPNHYIDSSDNAPDIQKYIQVTLADRDSRKRLLRGKASQELKDKIEMELMRQAKGM